LPPCALPNSERAPSSWHCAELGGMAANDGPVPVRTLAHASRLMRDIGRYGAGVASEAVLDYTGLLARVRNVVDDVRSHSYLRRHSLESRVS
jgi:pyruvate/2-oxoglutarate dehydrogenase complex dihydrolipoamide dehydrogenase (E3) component